MSQGVTGFSTAILSQLNSKLRAKLVLRILRDWAVWRQDLMALVDLAGDCT
jgi:hypothetical protein